MAGNNVGGFRSIGILRRIATIALAVACALALALAGRFAVYPWLAERYYAVGGGRHLELTTADGSQSLFWFDTWHSVDERDPMFAELDKRFAAFHPDLVLVEGSAAAAYDEYNPQSRSEAILGGESTYAVWLARQQGIAAADLEPSLADEIAFLQTAYGWEEILAMYVARQVFSEKEKLAAIGESVDYAGVIEWITDDLAQNGFRAASVDLAAGEDRAAGEDPAAGALADSAFDLSDTDAIRTLVDGYLPDDMAFVSWQDGQAAYKTEGLLLAAPYWASVDFRDAHVRAVIADMRATHDRIFVVMGNYHKSASEPALRALYQ